VRASAQLERASTVVTQYAAITTEKPSFVIEYLRLGEIGVVRGK
jgi:hypothetical protein